MTDEFEAQQRQHKEGSNGRAGCTCEQQSGSSSVMKKYSQKVSLPCSSCSNCLTTNDDLSPPHASPSQPVEQKSPKSKSPLSSSLKSLRNLVSGRSKSPGHSEETSRKKMLHTSPNTEKSEDTTALLRKTSSDKESVLDTPPAPELTRKIRARSASFGVESMIQNPEMSSLDQLSDENGGSEPRPVLKRSSSSTSGILSRRKQVTIEENPFVLGDPTEPSVSDISTAARGRRTNRGKVRLDKNNRCVKDGTRMPSPHPAIIAADEEEGDAIESSKDICDTQSESVECVNGNEENVENASIKVTITKPKEDKDSSDVSPDDGPVDIKVVENVKEGEKREEKLKGILVDGDKEKDTSKEEETDEKTIASSPDKRFMKFDVEIGRGSFKTVYKGLDTDSGVQVAWCELQVSLSNFYITNL